MEVQENNEILDSELEEILEKSASQGWSDYLG
jgi:hypothetical protein